MIEGNTPQARCYAVVNLSSLITVDLTETILDGAVCRSSGESVPQSGAHDFDAHVMAGVHHRRGHIHH
jgi:hypothetical protein